ncbi:MAG: RseA family anti-sigma factor [Gammaproteobacteria bacterium]
MNISIEEQISALMDGELSDTETHNLISTLQHDPELKKVWGSYHLIRAAIHNDLPDKLEQDVARNVINALASEPTVLAPRSVALESKLRSLSPAFRQIAGLAVAASVTALAILSVQTLPQDPLSSSVQVASFAPANTGSAIPTEGAYSQAAITPVENVLITTPVAPAFLTENIQTDQHWDLGDPAFEAKLNTYLNNHNHYSVPADMQGVLPHARMVGYGQDQ